MMTSKMSSLVACHIILLYKWGHLTIIVKKVYTFCDCYIQYLLCLDACGLTLDPNTAHSRLILSEKNRKVTLVEEPQSYPDHPERFDGCPQVLCRDSLSGRCYWEVEWIENAIVSVTYKGIRRKGGSCACEFGYNKHSWSLICYNNKFSVWHNLISIDIVSCRRVGVYVDVPAGTLSFYSVSDTHTLTHLHTYNNAFTESLYAGFTVFDSLSLYQ